LTYSSTVRLPRASRAWTTDLDEQGHQLESG
jgi:hypothetical protein